MSESENPDRPPSTDVRVPQVAMEGQLLYEDSVDLAAGSDELAVTIVESMAEVTDRPVTELVERITEAVDPDALDRVFRPLPDGRRRTGLVSFLFCGCRVTLDSLGRLRIHRPEFDPGTGAGDRRPATTDTVEHGG